MATSLIFACQFASSAFLIWSALVTSAAAAIQADRLYSVRIASFVGNGTYYTTARSRIECATLLSQDDQCDISSYDDLTMVCTFNRDIVTGLVLLSSITQTVMIRRSLKIVLVHTDGNTQQTLAWHGIICGLFGGSVAAYSQVDAAYVNNRLHVEKCSRVSNWFIYNALQYDVPGIVPGSQGVNRCLVPDCTAVFCVITWP